jgi:hypothetical protein
MDRLWLDEALLCCCGGNTGISSWLDPAVAVADWMDARNGVVMAAAAAAVERNMAAQKVRLNERACVVEYARRQLPSKTIHMVEHTAQFTSRIEFRSVKDNCDGIWHPTTSVIRKVRYQRYLLQVQFNCPFK